MQISEKEFEKLQKLSCIRFSGKEKKVFLEKLDGVIDFLGQLKNIPLHKKGGLNNVTHKFLPTNDGITLCPDVKNLLDNVEHESINNSVVIKSVLSE